ncbi:hypothetical protein SAMN05421595_0054 [Austwickia chelonae]|uniref:Uncharacterized protein n=1 Tax=Austwickia chelonae NBRC 105200 TaxID=1184607 RepID=K6V9C5_9MICO|nr:hypothetical protein [Austwickia chelonae]GAB78843.1 hypothetical protein AUCHE_17_00550 [Austwickia chelonae NBRC 105200]SEV85176.1 hypothetical protein SAMN05421595_0054 [Austwickia chelonae]
MHRTVKGLTGVGPAVLFLAFLSVAWGDTQPVTETISVPATYLTQDQHEKFALDAHHEVEYVAPAGWQRAAQSKKDEVMYRDGKHVIAVSLVKGIDDMSSAIDHRIRSAALKGELIHLKNQKITTPNGFIGSRCRVTSRSDGQHGDCALLGRKNFMIAITSVSEEGGDPVDVDQLISSLSLKEEG